MQRSAGDAALLGFAVQPVLHNAPRRKPRDGQALNCTYNINWMGENRENRFCNRRSQFGFPAGWLGELTEAGRRHRKILGYEILDSSGYMEAKK